MRLLQQFNGSTVLLDLSAVLGILFFVFAPTNLITLPIKILMCVSIGLSLLSSLIQTALLVTALATLYYTCASLLPIGCISLVATYLHLRNLSPQHYPMINQFTDCIPSREFIEKILPPASPFSRFPDITSIFRTTPGNDQ